MEPGRRGKSLKKLKEEVQQGPADVIIGKHGVTEAVLAEIKRRLEDKGVVKVKALRTAIKTTGMNRRELAHYVAERLGAWLLDVRGRTFVLYLPVQKRRGGGESAAKPNNRPVARPRRGGRDGPWSRR